MYVCYVSACFEIGGKLVGIDSLFLAYGIPRMKLRTTGLVASAILPAWDDLQILSKVKQQWLISGLLFPF